MAETDFTAALTDPDSGVEVKPSSPMQDAWRMFRGNITAMFGLVLLIVIVLSLIHISEPTRPY